MILNSSPKNTLSPATIKKSVFLNLASSMGLIIAIPIALAGLIIWQDSPARQLFIVGSLIAITAFALQKEKYQALFLSILFFTQFSTSLHTFELSEPLKFQIFFLDILLLLWLISSKEIGNTLKADRIGKVWIILMIWMLVTTYFSARTDKSLLFMFIMAKSLMVYLITRNMELDNYFIRRVVIIASTILVIQGLISGLQYIQKGYLGLVILGERNPEVSQLHFVRDSLRVSGTLGAVNALGGYISVIMVFLTPYVLAGKKNKFLFIIYCASYATLILPFSRAGWLSYFIGALICVFNLLRTKSISFGKTMLIGLFTSIILASVVFVFIDKIQDRFENKNAVSSAEGRIGQFFEAINVIERYPITGIGPGITEFFGAWTHTEKYVEKTLPGVKMYNQYHNNFLQFCVENGIPGAFLFLCLFGLIGFNALNPSLNPKLDINDRLLVIGASAAAFSFLIHSSFGPEINNERLLIIFSLLLGLARNKKFINQTTDKKQTTQYKIVKDATL